MLPCLALSIIRYLSRVKWSNLGGGVAPSPKGEVVIEKGAFWSPPTTVANFTYFYIVSTLNIYHRTIFNMFEGMKNVKTSMDDIVIWGTDAKSHLQMKKVLT